MTVGWWCVPAPLAAGGAACGIVPVGLAGSSPLLSGLCMSEAEAKLLVHLCFVWGWRMEQSVHAPALEQGGTDQSEGGLC
ncbi:MAG: hypothetical protein J0H57_20655, partial [Rhodospirillales bacterium]|nr:hypothetical protein [Rhodospirillales bacterium]